MGFEGSYDRVAAFARTWSEGQSERVNPASKRTLKAKLEELERDAVRLLTVAPPPPPPPPPGPTPPGPAPIPPVPPQVTASSTILVEEAQQLDLDSEAAALLLNALKERFSGDHELELSLSWRIARRSPQQ